MVAVWAGDGEKGREWKVVYAVGWSEHLLPHRKAEDIDEERRIAYVMASRARDFLAISSLQNWSGATVDTSRFLTGLNLRSNSAPSPSSTDLIEKEDELGGLFI